MGRIERGLVRRLQVERTMNRIASVVVLLVAAAVTLFIATRE